MALLLAALIQSAVAQTPSSILEPPSNPYSSLLAQAPAGYPITDAALPFGVSPTSGVRPVAATDDGDRLPTSASWIVPADGGYPSYVDADVYVEGEPYPHTSSSPLAGPPADAWCWYVLPDGLIYRSYQAGPHESRIGLNWFSEADGRNLWDATLGGRAGLLRFGTSDPLHPQGWQLDIEGAAIVRLNLENNSDLESADFRFGVPLTYGIDNWQFKFGYYHLSSHLGDERAIREPATLADRINYVRDSLVLGGSYYPVSFARLYAETAYATNNDGGAEPWEFQFGTELSKPGLTGPAGSPFLALNVHLREEHDFGGDVTTQLGWLWRGASGQTMRVGAHYLNGKSSQWQTFDESEQQIGAGLWYDF